MKSKPHNNMEPHVKLNLINFNKYFRIIFSAILLFVLIAINYSICFSQNKLVAYYPFNGNTLDATGNGHDGVLIRDIVSVADRFGKPNSAYSFNGSSSFISIPHSDDLRASRGSTISICVWVKFCSKQTDFAGIICKGPQNVHQPGEQLVIRDGYAIEGQVSTLDKQVITVRNAFNVYNDGLWHLVVMVVNTKIGELSIYVDGKREASVQSTIIDPSIEDQSKPMYIGVERNLSKFFNGSLDDIRIYNYSLVQSEINFLLNENGWVVGSDRDKNTNGKYIQINSCNSFVTLTADSGYSNYIWSTGEKSQNIAVQRQGVYIVTKSSSTRCSSNDTFDVKFGLLNVNVNREPKSGVCKGSIIKFNVNNILGKAPYKFEWRALSLNNSIFSYDSFALFKVLNDSDVVSLVVYDISGCEFKYQWVLMNSAIKTEISPSKNFSICNGTSASFNIKSLTKNNYTYTWSPTTGIGSPIGDFIKASPSKSTMYKVTIRDSNGCESFDSVFVKVTNGLSANYTDKFICTGEQTLLTGKTDSGSAPFKYSWSPSQFLSNSSLANPFAFPKVTTKFKCIIIDAIGCTDSVFVNVNVANKSTKLMGEPNDIIDLGSIEQNFIHCRDININNMQSTPITIDALNFLSNKNYIISKNPAPFSIPPLSTKTFNLCFMPLIEGFVYDTLLLDIKGSCSNKFIVNANSFYSDSMGKGCSTQYLKLPKNGFNNLLKLSQINSSYCDFKVKVQYPPSIIGKIISIDLIDIKGELVKILNYSKTGSKLEDEINFEIGEIILPINNGIYFLKVNCGGASNVIKVFH